MNLNDDDEVRVGESPTMDGRTAAATVPERPVFRLEDWVLELTGSPYQPPEARHRFLTGRVYGNPAFADGHRIRTGVLIRTRGRVVMTASGSLYLLGAVDPNYREWIATHHPEEWDDENPVRIASPFGV